MELSIKVIHLFSLPKKVEEQISLSDKKEDATKILNIDIK